MPLVDPTEQGDIAVQPVKPVQAKGSLVDPTENNITAVAPIEQGFMARTKEFITEDVPEFFTGSERETRATQELPELGRGGLLQGEDQATIAKVSPAILSTFEPQEIAETLTRNFPNIGITQDEKGNLIASNNKTGAQVIVNKPGMSGLDFLQAMGVTAAFFPAAKAANLATTIPAKAAAVGTASAATQTGLDLGQQVAGRTEDVSLGNIDAGDVAVAGLGGAAFEALFQGLSRAVPLLRQQLARTGQVTDEMRQTVRSQAVELGIDPEAITDDVVEQLARAADDAATPGQTGAVQGEREFGIDLSRGQREGTQSALRKEDVLFSRAPDTRSTLEQAQSIQGREAAQTIREGLGGQAIETPQAVGGAIRQGVQEAESAADAIVRQAFDEVGDAALTPEGFKGLLNATKNAVRGVEFDRTLPETAKILSLTNKTLNNLFRKKGVRAKPVNIQTLEQMRQRIGTAISSAEKADKRQVTMIKRAWDDYLDDAVQNALLTGDDAALEQLKNSRSLFSEYAKKFRQNPQKGPSGRVIDTDAPGKMVEKIVDANPTDIEINNALFGAGNTFGGPAAKNMALRFKSIVDDEGWNAIRQGGFNKLLKFQPDGKTISGQRSATALRDAMDKNRELMTTLYSPEEIALFNRFIKQVQRTQPIITKQRGNPSGTAQAMIDATAELGNRVMRTLGATGQVLSFVAGQGFESNARRAAREAVRPFARVVRNRPSPVALSTGVAAQEE